MTGVQSDCDAGFYCGAGSYQRSPHAALSGESFGDVCPVGHYCVSGVSAPTECTPGYYCPTEFMTAMDSTLLCQKGYYCSGGALSATPNGVWDEDSQNPS